MSAGVVYRRALSILGECELPAIATRDVLAVLEDCRPGTLDFMYQAAHEAGLERELALDRGAAIYFNHCAGQVADDIADGDLTYLERPLQTGPAAQFILQNLFYATLARCNTRVDVIATAAFEMAQAAGPQHIEARIEKWTAELSMQVAEGIVGLQYASYLRLLWSDTLLEESAPSIGRRLGISLHVATDAKTDDPRFATLTADDQRELAGWAYLAARSLRSEGIGCLEGILDEVERVLGDRR